MKSHKLFSKKPVFCLRSLPFGGAGSIIKALLPEGREDGNMGEIISTSFDNVAPLFAVVFLGYALRRLGVMREKDAVTLNSLCFHLLIPCLCIRSLQSVVFDGAYLRLLLYVGATYAVTIPLLCLLVPRLIPRRGQAGVVIQAAYRSNDVLLGIPLMENICGPDRMAPMLIVIAEVLILYNVTAVIILSRFSEREDARRPDAAAVAMQVIRNPILAGTLLGLLLRLLPFTLPVLVAKPLNNLASSASTVAMLAIGLRFRLAALSGDRRAICLTALIKLVILPVIWCWAAVWLGYRGDLMCAVFLVHACPTATSSAPLADAMGCDGLLAGELVLVTTGLSMFTIFCGVVILRASALI